MANPKPKPPRKLLLLRSIARNTALVFGIIGVIMVILGFLLANPTDSYTLDLLVLTVGLLYAVGLFWGTKKPGTGALISLVFCIIAIGMLVFPYTMFPEERNENMLIPLLVLVIPLIPVALLTLSWYFTRRFKRYRDSQ